MFRDDQRATIQLFTNGSFSARIEDELFLDAFKEMSRDDPVMALRFFKTPCFIPRYVATDAEDFRSFVCFMLKHNREVALSLFSKPHFAKRIKHNDYPDYDQLFDKLGKLGTMYRVSRHGAKS